MNLDKITLLIFSLIFTLNLIAQSSIEGIWKGTSICHIKNSPCHDEQVVYHISKDTGPNKFQVIANKIVDGKEDNMGTLGFIFDPQKETFICIDDERNARWEFQKKGEQMSGKLIVKNELFRIVNIKKEN